ncbi:YtzC family protein [Aeribacillus pallidus]|uniref:YtzC family protein n=1 Tax=Aeribacillus pallidus TaxID=33936 RepID=UPI003D1A1EE4
MATRQSIEEFLERCEEVLESAKEQYIEGSKQEHYYDEQFQQALQQLEEAYNDLMHLSQSANAQQKEQLHRMRLQLQQLQNDMILLDHDR